MAQLKGVNDLPEHAHELGALLKGKNAIVNLIPYNVSRSSDPMLIDWVHYLDFHISMGCCVAESLTSNSCVYPCVCHQPTDVAMGFETPEDQCVDEFFRLVSEYGLLCTVRPTHINLCLGPVGWDSTTAWFRPFVVLSPCLLSSCAVCPRSVGIMGGTSAGRAGSWC